MTQTNTYKSLRGAPGLSSEHSVPQREEQDCQDPVIQDDPLLYSRQGGRGSFPGVKNNETGTVPGSPLVSVFHSFIPSLTEAISTDFLSCEDPRAQAGGAEGEP